MSAVSTPSPFNAAAAAATAGADFLSGIEKNIQAGDLERAHADLLSILHSLEETTPEYLSRVYQVITALLPTLESEQFSILCDNLVNLPTVHLPKEQFALCLALGNGYRKHANRKNQIHQQQTAMHQYAIGIAIATQHLGEEQQEEAHRNASSLFTTLLEEHLVETDRLQELAQDAFRQGDQAAMRIIFDRLAAMHTLIVMPKCQKLFQDMYRSIQRVLTTGAPRPEFRPFLESLRPHLTDLPLVEKPATQRYREALEQYRAHFQSTPVQNLRDFDTTQARQLVALREFRNFFDLLIKDALLLMGPSPCSFEIRVKGSIGRGIPCPYSDFEWFIVIEEGKHKEYFKRLAQIIEMQVLSLGETDHTSSPPHGCIEQTIALYSDPKPSQDHPSPLIGTAEEIAAGLLAPSDISRDLMHSQVLHSSGDAIQGVFDAEVESILKEEGKQLSLASIARHMTAFKPMGTTIHVKNDLIRLLFYLLTDIGLHFQIHSPNVFDLIDELCIGEYLTKDSAVLIKQALSTIYCIRVRLHQNPKLREMATFTPTTHGAQVLTADEQRALQETYWLVLRPFYATLEKQKLDDGNVDLPKAIFTCLPLPDLDKCSQVFNLLIESNLIDEYAPYYRMLFAYPELRWRFLLALEKSSIPTQQLMTIPSEDGLRMGQRNSVETLNSALQDQVTSGTTHQVAVRCAHWRSARYLVASVADTLLDDDLQIQKQKADASHEVAAIASPDLHFKAMPHQPVMEYAVHSLCYRIFGKMTPPTQLARFDVSDGSYPVLVSETIPGKTLKEEPNPTIKIKSLTRMLICTILTKPRDGRASNYIVTPDEEIFCIDNDVSFTAPIERKRMISRKVNLASVLFCMESVQLNKATLEEFCALSPEAILLGWLEELTAKEQEYLALFSDIDERVGFYTKDPDKRVVLSPLFRQGALATLYWQFVHLQREITAKEFNVSSDELLEMVVHVDQGGNSQIIGPLIAKQYQAARAVEGVDERLNKAIEEKRTASMSSSQSLAAILGKVPTTEELEETQVFGLQRAKKEIFPLVLGKVFGKPQADQMLEGDTLELSFERTPLPEQRVVMGALKQYFQDDSETKFTSIRLHFCKVIEGSSLDPLLGDAVKKISLQYCVISSNLISKIAENCPGLEELDLTGSTISSISGFLWAVVKFPSLKKLFLSNCQRLKSLRINAPILEEVTATNAENLDGDNITLNVPSEANLDFWGSPRAALFAAGALEKKRQYQQAAEYYISSLPLYRRKYGQSDRLVEYLRKIELLLISAQKGSLGEEYRAEADKLNRKLHPPPRPDGYMAIAGA